MTTIAIPNTKEYQSLIEMIDAVLSPSCENMEAFKQKLNQSELALLFSTVARSKTAKTTKAQSTSPKTKTARSPTKPADIENRCEALVFAYEMDESGELVPARCKRCGEGETKFCKQHGAIDGKKNVDDSNYHGKDIIHEFKWGHLGTYTNPSYVFELQKAKDELLRKYQSKQSGDSGSSDEESAVVEKPVATPAKKGRKPSIKKEEEPKQKKAVANPYIFYKSAHHHAIKAQLEAETELKGKELANEITRRASKMWKELSAEEQATYRKSATESAATSNAKLIESDVIHSSEDTPMAVPMTPKAAQVAPIQQFSSKNDEEENIPDVDGDDEEEDTMVFNEKHRVWVDTDNNLCYATKSTEAGPIGQIQRGQFIKFPTKKN